MVSWSAAAAACVESSPLLDFVKIIEMCFCRLPLYQIERVKALYRDLDLESVYYKYEEETHKQIKDLIAKVEHIPHEVR